VQGNLERIIGDGRICRLICLGYYWSEWWWCSLIRIEVVADWDRYNRLLADDREKEVYKGESSA
jgi:hypothetical protein